MARVKQATQVITFKIEQLKTWEDLQQIKGMIEMAERLDKLSFYEALDLNSKAWHKFNAISHSGAEEGAGANTISQAQGR